ncbi:unnamed protein product [Rhizophagus irregularis]|nr:unnamed protein product [Rhizophagus irregularis]
MKLFNYVQHQKNINKTSSTSNKYNDIINLMQNKAEYDPICIDDAYLEGMELPFNITLYSYYNGNYIESQALLKAHESLPNYSIRQMRKNVINKHSPYTRLPLAILCAIYQDLTGNAINNSNLISKEVQECIKLIFKGTKFDEFWNEMDAYFNEIVLIDDIPQICICHSRIFAPDQTITTGDFNQLHFIPDPQISSDHQRFSIPYMDVILLEVDLQSKKNNLVCQEPAPDGMLVAARENPTVNSHGNVCIYMWFAYVPENHPLVFVRMNLTCDSPFEQTYYSCRIMVLKTFKIRVGFQFVFYHFLDKSRIKDILY